MLSMDRVVAQERPQNNATSLLSFLSHLMQSKIVHYLLYLLSSRGMALKKPIVLLVPLSWSSLVSTQLISLGLSLVNIALSQHKSIT